MPGEVKGTLLCLCRRAKMKVVLLGVTILGQLEPDENRPLKISNQRNHGTSNLEVTPAEYSVSRVNQVDSGHSRALSSSTTSSSSSEMKGHQSKAKQ